MPIPADNLQTPEKIALGKMLFFDRRLSGPNTVSCGTCHQPGKGMGDGLPRSFGVNGELSRNAPTIWNTAYMRALHADGNRASLEEQVDKSIPGLAMGQPFPALLEELGAIAEYRDRFARVFPDGITQVNIAKAIAAFERSLVTFNSPFDRYRAGDKHALSSEQKKGMDLFFSTRTACSSCHVAPLFTDNAWHNLGVPQVGPKAVDNGRADVTKNPADTGAFKTPMLRHIDQTGPYMHDGVFNTLEEVVAFYVGGGGQRSQQEPADEAARPHRQGTAGPRGVPPLTHRPRRPGRSPPLALTPRPRPDSAGERHRPVGTPSTVRRRTSARP